MATKIQKIQDYIGYIKCGEILKSPFQNYQNPFVLKCFQCAEIHFLLESFIIHIQEHCKDAVSSRECNETKTSNVFSNQEQVDSEGAGVENLTIKLEANNSMELEDPLTVVKTEIGVENATVKDEYELQETEISNKNFDLEYNDNFDEAVGESSDEFQPDDTDTDDDEMSSIKMSNNDTAQNSKGKLNYFPQEVNSKCHGCDEVKTQLFLNKKTSQKQYNTIVNILAEHKLLLDNIVTQNAITTNMMSIFPINTNEEMKEFNDILATQADPHMRQMKLLLAGNAERNLHEVFGQNILMSFNVDGSFGKGRLRDFTNVYTSIIDVISTFSESPEKILRAAFQRQKKKFFKQSSRCKAKQDEQPQNNGDSL